MVLTAFRGAVGFLTRIPAGHDEAAWQAFTVTPVTIPLVGYLVGGLVVLPLLAPVPAPSVALGFVAAVYLLTGITHLDGVADVGDAAAVHGDREDGRDAMTDSLVGTGGVLAVAVTLLGLATAALVLAGLPWRALGIVVAAEVGAKGGMALLACLGTPAFEGMGSTLTDRASVRSAVAVAVVAAPTAVLTWPTPLASAVAVGTALATSALVYAWARRYLGGLTGDVLGAANELGRVAALHAGVIAWTLS